MAEAVTRAVDTVDTGDATYVLLLHDDVSLEPDAVERMVTTARTDPAIAAVGAKLLEWFQPEVLQEVGAAIDRYAIRRTALDPGEVDSGQRDDTTDVLFCSDACLLVRRDAFVEIGGLDAKAWPFYEDVDLCWRLRAGGARVVVEPQARVRHAADLSGGRRLFDSLTLREHAEHGRLRFMLKHYALLGLDRPAAAARGRNARAAPGRARAARAVARARDRPVVGPDDPRAAGDLREFVDGRRRRASRIGSCSHWPRAAPLATCAATGLSGRPGCWKGSAGRARRPRRSLANRSRGCPSPRSSSSSSCCAASSSAGRSRSARSVRSRGSATPSPITSATSAARGSIRSVRPVRGPSSSACFGPSCSARRSRRSSRCSCPSDSRVRPEHAGDGASASPRSRGAGSASYRP